MTINQAEQKAKELLKAGKPVHGYARDLLWDAALREMMDKDKAIAIVKEMEQCGYCLFNETAEQFVDRLHLNSEQAAQFAESFKKAKGVN